jgi:hypothetical protein
MHSAGSWALGWSGESTIASFMSNSLGSSLAEKLVSVETIREPTHGFSSTEYFSIVRKGSNQAVQVSQRQYCPKPGNGNGQFIKASLRPETVTMSLPPKCTGIVKGLQETQVPPLSERCSTDFRAIFNTPYPVSRN